jgi:hypothetical protein
MLNFAADVKTTVKLPDLAGLRAVSNADTTRLAAAPQAAATSLAKYMTAGAKAPQAASFTPNADVSELLVSIARDKAALAKDKSVRGASNTFTASKTSPAFMTKSGTAIVFVSLTDEYALLVGKNYEYWWSAAPKTAFSPATVKYQSALTTTTLHDVVLLIPPKGKIQIASFDSQLIDAGGY